LAQDSWPFLRHSSAWAAGRALHPLESAIGGKSFSSTCVEMLSLGSNGLLSGLNLTKSSNDVKKSATPEPKNGTVDEEVPQLGGAASRRRLRHISQIAIRGLDFEAATSSGFYLEVLAEGSEEQELPPLERSDLLRTRNPTWAPVCGIRHGKNLDSCELRAVAAKGEQMCWRSTIRLAELEPLGEELEDLKVPLPPAMPILRLGDKWYSLPGVAPTPTSSSAQPSPDRRRPPKQITASQICEAGKNISTLLSRLKSLQAQSNTLRDAMEQTMEQGRSLHERRERHASCEQRVRQLRSEAERRRNGVSQLRERLEGVRTSQETQAEQLQQQRRSLASTEEEQATAASSLPAVYSGLRTLWQQLRCRRIRMLHEVCQVYPIESCGTYRTIRGLCVAEIRQLSRVDLREEENISTALGYLSHLLVTLASILEVPLRVRVHHAGCSRSYLSDPHESPDSSTPPKEFPLYYGRGLEKSRFMDALRLLRDGVNQFLYSRGYFDEKRAGAGNLLESFELIIQKEMYGID